MRLSHLRTFGILLLAVSTSLAITTLTPGSEESTSTILPSIDNESSTDKEIPKKLEKSEITDSTPNQEKFRQALSQEQQQNCLSQLLCGVRPAKQPSKATNYVNDLAYVVKEFFDIIDVAGEGDAQDDEEDDEKKASVKTKTKSKGEAKSPYYKITNVDTKPKIVQQDDIGDDEQDDDPIRNTEEAMDKEVEFRYSGIKKITLEELVDDIRLRPQDIVVYKNRKGGSRTGRMMMSQRASQDLRRKMRQIKSETDDKKKLSIAADIANKLRSPRQCRQLTGSSQCPLTREVIKYLQTNIANGAEKQKNETALATLNYAAQQGFLLVEDDKGQTQVADHSPLVSNNYVATDLKNPTVPNRFQPKVVAQPAKKKVEESDKEKDEDEDADADADDEDDDEDNEAEEDNNEEDEEQDDEEDSGGNEQDDDDTEDEEEDEEEETRRRKLAEAAAAKEQEEKNRAQKMQMQKMKKTKPPPSLPSGIIRVYGVPQTSFDNDFNRVSATIGKSNVQLFDQDDYDSVLMSGYPDDKLPTSSHQEKNKVAEKKISHTHGRNSNSRRHKKRRPAPTSDSVEDEPSDDETSDDEPAIEESQTIIIKSSAQKPQTQTFIPSFAFGGGGQNYFHSQNDRSAYDPRPLPMRTRNADFRRPEFGRPARFYPMPFPNYPRY